MFLLRPDDYDYSTEASTLGLGPGRWPNTLRFEGNDWVFIRHETVEGEIISAVYTDVWTRLKRLVVFND